MKKSDHYIALCLCAHYNMKVAQDDLCTARLPACSYWIRERKKKIFLNPVFLGPDRPSDGLLFHLNARWHTLTFVPLLKTCSVISINAIIQQTADACSVSRLLQSACLPASHRAVSTPRHILVLFTLRL